MLIHIHLKEFYSLINPHDYDREFHDHDDCVLHVNDDYVHVNVHVNFHVHVHDYVHIHVLNHCVKSS